MSRKAETRKAMQEYVDHMEEIKWRHAAVKELSNKMTSGQVHIAVATDWAYLQLRKILELIAMSSLVANKQALEEMDRSMKKLGKEWHGNDILKIVKGINPDFYPVPLIEEPSSNPNPAVKTELVDKPDGFLDRRDFSRLYGICGKLLHADNPLGKKTDYVTSWNNGPVWERKIIGLLNCHKIRLVDQDGFYLVHMSEAQRGGKAYMYEFSKYTGPLPPVS